MTSLRDAQVQALIAHNERLLAALVTIAEGVNTWLDHRHEWSDRQLGRHMDDLQQVACEAIAQAEENGR
jgi:hypothetical protein